MDHNTKGGSVQPFAVALLHSGKDDVVLRALQHGLACAGASVRCLKCAVDLGRLDEQLALILVDSTRFQPALRTIQTLLLANPHLPVLVISCGLAEKEIIELSLAGACDFVRLPIDASELVLRAKKAIVSFRQRPISAESVAVKRRYSALAGSAEHCISTAFHYGRDVLENMLGAGGACVMEPSPSAAPVLTLKAAKSLVVERFEREFLLRLIGMCSGNLALAAKMAGKHRRAMFELLRKHDIDSAVFRNDVSGRAKPSSDSGQRSVRGRDDARA